VKRSEIVAQHELVPPEGQLVLVLRDGGYRLLDDDRTILAGEVAVLYEIDRDDDADLMAANALFNDDFYPRQLKEPWPDEAEAIRELVPLKDAEVLEVACGAGRLARALIRGNNRVTAVDISEECIRRAQADIRGVDFRVADALNLPFSDKSFDVVCCFNNSLGVFFSQRRRLLSEMVRVARRRVLLGLYQLPSGADELVMYASPHGFLEFSRPHSLAGFRPFLDLLPGEVHFRNGEVRPWGHQHWFLAVDLGTDSAPRSRKT
jgi:ubiquinone/menaquinone biosynthesis C-methylase UbiE